MAKRQVYKLYEASSIPELVKQLNVLFRDISEMAVRVDDREGSSPAKSSVDFNLKRLSSIARPLDPSDGVRLQDLRDLESRINQRLGVVAQVGDEFTTGGGGQTASAAVKCGVGFVETFDGTITSLTPLFVPALDDDDKPIAMLVQRDGVLQYTTNPTPTQGLWTWDETNGKVVVNLADAPESGDYFEFGVMVVR